MDSDRKIGVYYPADIEIATGGYANRRVQQTWHARGIFVTPTETPAAGKPREYRRSHLYESVIFSEVATLGLTLEFGRSMILRRVMTAGERKSGGWVGEKLGDIDRLPEFVDTAPQSDWLWVVVPEITKHAAVATLARPLPDIAKVLTDVRSIAPVLIFNITALVRKVHERLGIEG